jgi:DNA-binding NarL/FixJ family response regulator
MLVCGEATDAPGAVSAALRQPRPDLCLIDHAAPLDAVALTADISASASQVAVVLLGWDGTDSMLLDAVAAGASGYLAGDCDSPRLIAALQDVAAGRPAFPRRLATLLIDRLNGALPG